LFGILSPLRHDPIIAFSDNYRYISDQSLGIGSGMKRLLPKLLCSLVALMLVSQTVQAQQDNRPRRPGFFERIFGIQPRARRAEKRTRQRGNTFFAGDSDFDDGDPFFKPRRKQRPLFSDDDASLFGRPRISRKKAKRGTQLALAKPTAPIRVVRAPKKPVGLNNKSVAQAEDPEPFATLGMGNLPFLPARTVALYADNALSFNADGAQETAIRELFFSKNNGISTEEKDRAAIFAQYSGFGYKPIWTVDGKATERAQAVLNVLAAAEAEGLEAASYLPAGLDGFDGRLAARSFTPQEQAKFDVGLTVAALRYARHVSGGQFDPRKLSLYHDLKGNAVEPAVALKVLRFSPYPQQYLQSLAPNLQEYRLLKAELGKYKNANRTEISSGDILKKDARDSRVVQLREYLLSESFLKPGAALVSEIDRDLMDAELVAALKEFQRTEKIKATGALDDATIKKLNIDRSEERRNALISSMERARWMPKDLGNRHVFVNQASYDVNVVDSGQVVWNSKVIVGKPMTQTYVFHDKMETVVFNPTWGLPQSIIMNEYMPKLRKDPAYFDKIGYEVIDKDGKKIKSKSVDWKKYVKGVPFNIVQPAGGDNALGELKFLFPNAHAIYMHDTPSRKLFKKSERAFSHGCVRVENPRDFASVLLGWERSKIDQILDDPDTLNQSVPGKVDVHLTYFTAWPDRSGVVRYHKDIYERDQTLLEAMRRVKLQTQKEAALTIKAGSALN
jgi:L,D-transpeptidase YcbB